MMCATIRLLVLALLATATLNGWCQQVSSTPDEVLTLDEAIALAVHENHSVKAAGLETGKAGDIVAATRTQRLPSMNVFAVSGEQFVKPEAVTVGAFIPTILPGVGPFFSIGIPRRPTAIFAGLILQPLSQQYRIGLDIGKARLTRNIDTERLRL